MALTTPQNLPAGDATLATDTATVLTNRALLAQLAAGQWLPYAPEELVAALTELAQEIWTLINRADPVLGGLSRPIATSSAWR